MKACSVIIPAHDEEVLIGDCIDSVLANKRTFGGELEVIVVANCCTDSTEEIVKGYGGVKLVESDIPKKTNALNLGDSVASYFPRIYVDGDLVVSDNMVSEIYETLSDGKTKFASTSMRMNLSNIKSRLARDYFEVWLNALKMRNTDPRTSRFGGVYALSEEGRGRFDRFPDVVADDTYVKNLFNADERKVNTTCFYYFNMPKTLKGALKQRMRWHAGNIQLKRKYPISTRFNGIINYVRKHIQAHVKRHGTSDMEKVLHFMAVYGAALVGGYLKYYLGNMNRWNGGRD